MRCCGFGGSPVSPPGTPQGVFVLDETVPVSPNRFTSIDFRGAGVTAADGGGGTAVVTIPGGGASNINVEQDGALVGAFTTLDFGTGLTVTNAGGGTAAINAIRYPNIMWVPEQWAENNVSRNLVNHVMDCQVSTSFDTFKMITAGSITGLSTRLSQPLTAGTMTVRITKNGVAQAALTLVHTNVSNQAGGTLLIPALTVTYIPGDLLGMFITTNNTLAPTSTDIEAMMQVTE